MNLSIEPIAMPVDTSPENIERFLKHWNVMAYMAHPFSGDFENIRRSNDMAEAILEKYPNIVLINPLTNFEYMRKRSEGEILAACLRVVRKCDILLLTGHWRMSRGCWEELYTATWGMGMPAISLADDLTPHAVSVVSRG